MKRNYMKVVTAALATVMAWSTASAQIPAGYYDALKGKKGAELKNAVHEIVKDAEVLSYGSGKGHTWEGFYSTDRLDDGQVVDRYSNDKRYFTSAGAVVGGMNIEHSFPKSWWGGTKNQAYQDLYNLMPSESGINSSKSNYPMGKVTNVKTDNGCTKVGQGSNGYQLWEPADKWKGDFARGYMYMATTYQNLQWEGTQALQILQQGDYPTLQKWAYTLYMEWARADKVTQDEAERNEAVSRIQGNRNPFVDFPNLMEYVWGDSVDYAFNPETTVKSTDYTGGGGTTDPVPTDITVYTATFTTETGDCVIENTSVPLDGFVVWDRDTKYGWKATAYSNSRNYESDASLVTPELDLSACSGAVLTFSHAANFCGSPSDTYAVEVRCDGQTVTLGGIAWPAGNSWTFKESGDISLDDFAGKKIKIAFHYKSTDSEAGTWEIKTMTVKGVKIADGITATPADTAGFDPSKPFDTYTTAGGKAPQGGQHGIVIIRQGGKAWKVVR